MVKNDNSFNFRSLVVGVDTKVPLVNGTKVTAINFDNAATTPPFVSVLNEVTNFSPWYSSCHRGMGYKSQLSTSLYEYSREIISEFVNADPSSHTVIFVKNTTEAINKLSNKLCMQNKNCVILSTDMEHHSNDLPWRDKFKIDYININEKDQLSLEDLEKKLIEYDGKVKLIAVTGASNVTGYVNPVHEAAKIAHKYGAKILVDGAQLIPHMEFNMRPCNEKEHIDFLVFSSHKMYAPFGIGVLIGPKCVFESGSPEARGGGTVKIVTHDYIKWADPPDKEEAGSPNVIGAVSLAAAIKTIKSVGMKAIEEYENKLTTYTLNMLKNMDDIILYVDPDVKESHVSIVPFNIKGMYHEITSKILSYEFGIATRSGCFCAHPYVSKLLRITPEEVKYRIEHYDNDRPGMVRLSFGLYNTLSEINSLIIALKIICDNKEYYIEKYSNDNFSFF